MLRFWSVLFFASLVVLALTGAALWYFVGLDLNAFNNDRALLVKGAALLCFLTSLVSIALVAVSGANLVDRFYVACRNADR